MKQLYKASTSPHYVFKYPNQSIIGDVPFIYQKNFLNKKELKIIEKLSKTLSYQKASIGDNENPKLTKEKRNSLIRQGIDLAKLSQNLLKGEELTSFIKRSMELIK